MSEARTVIDGPAPTTGRGTRAVGTQVGRFVVLHPLGKGAMGAVYVGYDVQLDRKVAIKVIRDEIASDYVRQRSLREAQALAKLSHPNVVHVYEVGEHERRLFVAMEHVDGENLRAWLRERPRSVAEILATVCAAGRGLAAAHAIGLVHRDVKPDNILVGRDGRARIADFGLVRAYGDRFDDLGASREALVESAIDRSSSWHDLQLTQHNAMIGTPAYMSPEQFRGRDVGPAADQFSFCATLYEALYETLPFPGSTVQEIRERVLEGAIASPPPGKAVPRWIFRALQRGLAPDPAARWPSLAALLDALGRDPSRRRNRILVAVTTVAVAVGGYALWRRLDPESPRCQGAMAQLAGVWDEARREALEAALVATGDAQAQVMASRVVQVLDGYAASWARMHTETCERHQRGEMSPALLDRAMSCLERRRGELGALVDVLGETTRGALHNAVQAAASLSRLAPCQDAEALLAATPPPDDPGTAAEVKALRGALDRALALENAGRYDDAVQVLEAARPRLARVGYLPLTAEAQLRKGSLQVRRGEFAAAAETLMEAMAQGHAGRADGVAADALINWLFAVGYGLERAREATTWYPFARAMTERLADRPELAPQLARTEPRSARLVQPVAARMAYGRRVQ